jgi:hypothetical protein
MQLLDTHQALLNRASIGQFQSKFGKQSGAMDNAVEALNKAIADLAVGGSVNQEQIDKVQELQTAVTDARTELEKYGELTAKGWEAQSGASSSAFERAKSAYEKASGKFENFLNGGQETLSGGGKVTVPDALKDAYRDAKKEIDASKSIMNGWFGKLRLNGVNPEGFQKTFTENLGAMKFWEEGVAKGPAFGKISLVAVGAGIGGHALCAGKDREGEPRSVCARIIEGAVGVLLAAGGLLGGKAL